MERQALGEIADGEAQQGAQRQQGRGFAEIGRIEALVEGFGLDLSTWDLTQASGVSADGTVIVGYGKNPSGSTEAWMAVIPQLGPAPAAPALSPAGLALFVGCILATAVWATRLAARRDTGEPR